MPYKPEAVPAHKAELADIQLLNYVGRTLDRHYPGHPWFVFVDSEGGILVIKHLGISSQYGFVLKLSRVYTDPNLQKIVLAAGELLERAALKRGAFEGKPVTRVEGLPEQYQPLRNGEIII